MKQLYFILGLLLIAVASCKNEKGKTISGLTDRYCDCLASVKTLPPADQIDSCDAKVLADSLDRIATDSAAEYFLEDMNVRLQKDCKAYKALLDSLNKDEDWTKADTGTASSLSALECTEFAKYRELFYVEPTHDTTYVRIENGVWNESLKGGKYFSKLGFSWTGDCEFSLSFIQSNDPNKGKLSRKGERYKYRILEKKINYFLVLGIVKGEGLMFRVFF